MTSSSVVSECSGMGAVFVAASTECWVKYMGGTPTTATQAGRLLVTPYNRSAGGAPMETHGPYQHGGGFPAVNGDAAIQVFNPQVPVALNAAGANVVRGVGFPSTFASEFGSSVFSSFESMAPTLAPAHWGVHGGGPPDSCGGGFERYCNGTNVMAQRNYPCDNIIQVFFGAADFDAVGEAAFKQQLWQCMVGQALLIKGTIENRRSTNQFGHLIWQLNEIWPTGGWGERARARGAARLGARRTPRRQSVAMALPTATPQRWMAQKPICARRSGGWSRARGGARAPRCTTPPGSG
jgi:hypothetical protein